MVIMLASARQERPLFGTVRDRSENGEVHFAPLGAEPACRGGGLLNSILEPAHSSDRTRACGLVLPGLYRVALLFELSC